MCCIYRAPKTELEQLDEFISNCCQNTRNTTVYLCGDFNIDLLQHDTNNITNNFIDHLYSFVQPGETVDVFLAELRRLAVPFGGLSDNMLSCAFVAGLPDTVKQLLRAGSRMDELPLAHILTRPRYVLPDEVGVAAAVSAMTVGADASVKRADATSGLLCFQCNQPNHLARDCLLRRKSRGDSYGGRGRGAGRGSARCYRSDGLGHFASSCPGNENGGRPSALVSNPGIL